MTLNRLMFRRTYPEPQSHTRELTLLNQHGLHARPATEFVLCALNFESEITIHVDGHVYRADRIMDVLLANLNRGDTFVLEAKGPDAEQAIERLSELIVLLGESDERAEKARNPHRGILD